MGWVLGSADARVHAVVWTDDASGKPLLLLLSNPSDSRALSDRLFMHSHRRTRSRYWRNCWIAAAGAVAAAAAAAEASIGCAAQQHCKQVRGRQDEADAIGGARLVLRSVQTLLCRAVGGQALCQRLNALGGLRCSSCSPVACHICTGVSGSSLLQLAQDHTHASMIVL